MKVSIVSFDYSDSAKFLYEKLKENEVTIEYCLTGEQTKEKIAEMSTLAESKSDTIFYVGGMGLSSCDILKDVLTERYGVNAVFQQKTQDFFLNFIEASRSMMPPVHVQERLLCFPEGFDCYPNRHGYEIAANGRFLGKEIFLIPDNLSECKYVYETYIENYLFKKDGSSDKTFVYKVFGLRKDEIEEKLVVLAKKNVKFFVDTDLSNDSKIVIKYQGRVAQSLIDDTNAFLMEAFGDSLYAVDDFSLSEVVADLLKLYKRKLSVAESLTGGEIVASLVDIPGVSDVLFEGCTTYANEAKQARLLVKQQTLAQFGAVSSETAYQMATGLLKTSSCDVVVATTGIAGPGGGSAQKPVGLTFIAVGDINGIHIHKFVFSGDRNEVRKKASKTALFLLMKLIKKRK